MFSSVRQGVFFHSSRGIDGFVKESFFAQLPQRGFRSIAAGLFAQSPQGLVAGSRSSREGFSFLLPEQKKRNKENSPSALFCLLRHFSPLNKKNSLTLKQLFVFYAPKSTSASRQKTEAGPFRFFATSLRSLGVWCFLFFASLYCLAYSSSASGLRGRA